MKSYGGEKAIISLTSWRKRINAVGLTLFNLMRVCPGFHIVLVLSSDEFPQKEDELPTDLTAMIGGNLIELLWVKENVKSMKKVIYTMQKYPDVPVISADDDCIYKWNYAEDLYNAWKEHKDCIYRYTHRQGKERATQGPCTIYPPNSISHMYQRMLMVMDLGIKKGDDDAAEEVIRHYNMHIGCVGKPNPFIFHTTEGAMHKQNGYWFYKGCF